MFLTEMLLSKLHDNFSRTFVVFHSGIHVLKIDISLTHVSFSSFFGKFSDSILESISSCIVVRSDRSLHEDLIGVGAGILATLNMTNGEHDVLSWVNVSTSDGVKRLMDSTSRSDRVT